MIKRLALLTALTIGLLAVLAFQPNPQPATSGKAALFQRVDNDPDWLEPRAGIKLSAQEVLQQSRQELQLTAEDEWRLLRKKDDELGFTHYRYRQYRRGIPIEAATLLLHERNGVLESLNGKWVRGEDQAATQAAFTAEAAIGRALQLFPAERYLWEDAGAEAMLRRVEGNPKATFYPQPELVLVDPSLEQRAERLQLAYRMEIAASSPLLQKMVYIDAQTGELLLALEQLHDHNKPGVANTVYSGQRDIVADSLAPDRYRLRETTRGQGIETYHMNRSTNYDAASDFIDNDNFWNAEDGPQNGEGTDAHWGAEMTFDYFMERHNYEGIDGNGMPLIGYVNYDINYNNAFWNGRWATYGDGDGSLFISLTSPDVVAHEFVHGVTDKTADLIYRNESGALNESFSDIFGALVEFYATPEVADWYIGEDFTVNDDNGIRSMDNPNTENDPDTYRGDFWFTGAGNNGGVHTNSGVQNFWFYLLTEGGSGTNDNGDAYAVPGIGLEEAAQIAFRNLHFYLAEASQYKDARQGALRAARDLYGACSTELAQATNAWHAVGVGERFPHFDLRPAALNYPNEISCGFPEDGRIEATFEFRSCVSSLAAGKHIPIAFQIDGGEIVRDTFVLSQELSHEGLLTVQFNKAAAALAEPGRHQLQVWTALEVDNIPENNILSVTIDNIREQNVDLSLQALHQPSTGCFLGQPAIEVEIGFFGCDSLPAGAPLTASLLFNGETVTETLQTPRTLFRGDAFRHTFSGTVEIPEQTGLAAAAWISYAPDSLNRNDTLRNLIIHHPKPLPAYERLTFESVEAVSDSFYTTVGVRNQLSLSTEAGNESNTGMRIVGSNSLQAFEQGLYTPPPSDDIWTANPDYVSELCFCADFSAVAEPSMLFDLQQTLSPAFILEHTITNRRMNALRVLVDGAEVAGPFLPALNTVNPWQSIGIRLDEYGGQQVQICLQATVGLSPENDPLSLGDVVHIDNITLGDIALSSEAVTAAEQNMELYPNPGREQLQLRYDSPVAQEIAVSILGLSGQPLRQLRYQALPGGNNFALPVVELPAGVYTVVLRSEAGLIARRWVKM